MKPERPFATWILKLFYSGPEHESVIGDLAEQCQQDRGHFWYWRQVLSLVYLALYNKVVRRPLIPDRRSSAGLIFNVILVMAVLFVALLSPIAPVLLIPVVIGSWLASIRAWRSKEPGKAATPFTGPAIARIDSSRITISGGLGAGILIVMLLGSVMIELPELRLWATPGLLAGLVVAVALRLWRRWHPRDMTKDWVSIKLGDVDQIQARRDSRRS